MSKIYDVYEEVIGKDNPPGWYEINGETGKSALIWSLCSSRYQQYGRDTLYVELGEAYDIDKAATWSGLDSESVTVIRSPENIIEDVINLLSEYDYGQIVLEDLGFLLGSSEDNTLLGDKTLLFKLSEIASEKQIAIYTTSYNVYSPYSIQKKHGLGQRILLSLSYEKKLVLKRITYLLKGGRRVGEIFSLTNTITEKTYRMVIRYNQGPVSIKVK